MPQIREGFVIVANRGKPLAMKAREEMIRWLDDHGQNIISEHGRPEEKSQAKFVVSLGGDGTAIHTVAEYSKYGVITIPINVDGGVGFLTIGNSENWKRILEKAISGRFEVKERTGLNLFYRRNFGPFANDVVLKHTASMTTLKVRIDNHVAYKRVMADGIIVSTSTGSTGYSMSIIHTVAIPTKLECFFVAPLNPDQFNVVPMVISPESIVEIEVIDSKPSGVTSLIVDGKTIGNVEIGEKILVRQHKTKLLFMGDNIRNFYNAMRNKKGLAK